jgi:hypothetical protein
MCPPSSWPAGIRLSEVANNPTHAARPIGCSTRSLAEKPGLSQASNKRSASGVPKCTTVPAAAPAITLECATPNASAGIARQNPTKGPAMPTSNRAPRVGIGERNAYECAKRADQRGRGDEIGIARVDAVGAASEVVAQFVREQNPEQRKGEWDSGREEAGVAEQFHVQREKLVEVGILALGVSARELRADRERGKQREQKKQKRDGKLFAAFGAAADLEILRGNIRARGAGRPGRSPDLDGNFWIVVFWIHGCARKRQERKFKRPTLAKTARMGHPQNQRREQPQRPVRELELLQCLQFLAGLEADGFCREGC